MTDLLELADRIEQAKGPQRELDAAIASVFCADVESDDGDFWWGCYDETPERVPDFTASLDAVVMLVPPCTEAGGDRWAVEMDSGFYGATAKLWHECSLKRHEGHAGGQHEALPRALCAAILRAIATEAQRAETPQSGSVHEGAGPTGIAQNIGGPSQ